MAIRPAQNPSSSGPVIKLASGESIELSWQERALCAQTDPEAFFLSFRRNASTPQWLQL